MRLDDEIGEKVVALAEVDGGSVRIPEPTATDIAVVDEVTSL